MIKTITNLKNNTKVLTGSKFVGTVVGVDDPLKLGRVNVELDNLTKGISVSDLPFYHIFIQNNEGGSNEYGKFHVPELNSRIVVEFLSDDIYSGIVISVLVNKVTKLNSDIFSYNDPIPAKSNLISDFKNQSDYNSDVDSDYPFISCFVDRIKNWFKVNFLRKEIEAGHFSGTKFKIDEHGNTTLHITGNFKLVVDGDFVSQSTNKTNISTGSHEVLVDGSRTTQVTGTEIKTASAIYLN